MLDFLELGARQLHKKGAVLLSQGEISQSLFFVRQGLLKAVYITAGGKETVKSFLSDGDLIGSLRSCVSGEPSLFSLVCLEDTDIVQLEFRKLQAVAQQDLQASQQLLAILLGLALKKERREYEFLCLSAQERYEALAEGAPHLLERLKQQDIARYLGVTPEALSRLRGQSRRA
jgi:CRP-like cAMP-binding protein